MLIRLFYVGLGGFLGSVGRYSISHFFHTMVGKNWFFISTLVVNVVGSFLIGVAMGAIHANHLDESFKYFLIIGVLGGFTTFSSFSLEAFFLLKHGHLLLAASYIAFSVIVCVFLTYFGYTLFK